VAPSRAALQPSSAPCANSHRSYGDPAPI
jgi:hypothetical protein